MLHEIVINQFNIILIVFPQENGYDGKSNGTITNSQKRNKDDKNNGYKTSMFRNNPQVPVAIFNKPVDSQIVNKNKNSLFSTSTYKDLTDLHSHMVSNN